MASLINSSHRQVKKAEAYYSKGLILNEQGNWGLAEEEFLKALVMFSKIQNYEKVVATHCSLGNVCFNKGNYSETLKHWLSALSIYEEKLNKKTEAGELCMEIGDLYYDLKNWYGAGQYYSRALTLFEEEPINNDLNFGLVNHKLGNVCFQQERYREAEKHFINAQPIYEKFSAEDKIADIFKGLGQIYLIRNDMNTSYKYFMRSFELYSRLEREDQRNEIATFLVSIENKREQKKLEKRQKDLEKKLAELEGVSYPFDPRYSGKDSLSYSDSGESEMDGIAMSSRTNSVNPIMSPLQLLKRPNTDPSEINSPSFVPNPPVPRNHLQQIFSTVNVETNYLEKKQKRLFPESPAMKQIAPQKKTTPTNPRRRL
mmetsp:Transcript_24874/g.34829  ORF Transcript_24874/g.34829 Transcript_24874/m.34829 type:complete len:372 (-) Transcript_24874:16-1131(-)